jgi:hypothetical protein
MGLEPNHTLRHFIVEDRHYIIVFDGVCLIVERIKKVYKGDRQREQIYKEIPFLP